jgi:proteasome lid subunit RPN8/RPN11
MGRKDKDAKSDPVDSTSPEKPQSVQTGGWDDHVKIRFRTFNGPAGASDPLRIAMSKEAYADIVGHAKESLDREICGVLLGDLCEDEYGRFLDIQAALRGGAAKGGGTHVTFTQETWNDIHAAKDERYPKLQIVGWYHSHPGFGVEFSDMDRFIQQNFFGGPGQIAFVTDPLGGQEAIDANVDGRIVPLERFWVDGRERRCYVPIAAPSADRADSTAPASAAAVPSDLAKRLDDLQDRVRQLTDAVEKQRSWFYNLLTFLGMLIAGCVIVGVAFHIYWDYKRPMLPPEGFTNEWTVPVPLVDPEGKKLLVTLTAKSWKVSPEVEETLWRTMVVQHKDEIEAAINAAVATRAAATATSTAPASASAPAPASATRQP